MQFTKYYEQFKKIETPSNWSAKVSPLEGFREAKKNEQIKINRKTNKSYWLR